MVSMPDYVNLLLSALNNYNEEDIKSKIALRDLVCIISDNEKQKRDPLIRELLFIASQKMRVFGYNVQNGFYRNDILIDQTASDLGMLRNQSIIQHYQSRVRANNILDKSQQEVINFFQSLEKKRMLVSAPTSYGKTFIMREILFLNHMRYNNILLVFPTVALLRENAFNMEELNSEKEMGYNVIKSIDIEVNILARNIFVFTPERAMQLLASYPDLKLDFFFYDEMYKIDEDYCYDETDEKEDSEIKGDKQKPYKNRTTFLDEARAKTFRICLYLLSKLVDEYYLAGPNLKKEKFGFGMKKYLEVNNIEVKEIEFEPTKRIQVNAYKKEIDEDYSNLPFIDKPEPVKMRNKVNERICDVVEYISSKGYGATMLYCTTPGKANEYATKLAAVYQGKKIEDSNFQYFIKHLKRTYDIDNSIKDWSFINVLEKGFGMHHGKMPKYIQKEVLELFNKGVFELLFCTSTIVEGVNTNAKNMVVLNHKKGGKDLTIFDFKNIIGRAGRYYHNFVGRFFLVDKELAKFENTEDLSLNFVTYDIEKLSEIDIDNAEIEDLLYVNRYTKEMRVQEQKNFILPDHIFNKNRLIKKEIQEKLLRFIITNRELFNKFYGYTRYPDILIQFSKYHAFNSILDIFQNAELLDEFTVGRYSAISNTYCEEGFKGILKYEIDNSRKEIITEDGLLKKTKTIDRAYMDAFKTQKEIIEHKIPKLLALFESIFVYAASLRKIPLNAFSLSKVVRFYETGVKSYFGEQLVEFGLRRYILAYLQGGMTMAVLIPKYKNCGNCKRIYTNKKPGPEGKFKLARDEKMEKIFSIMTKRYKDGGAKSSFQKIYDDMICEFYSEEKLINQEIYYFEYPVTMRPNYNQLKYWIKTHTSKDELLLKKLGKQKMRNNNRPLFSDTIAHLPVKTIGARYEMDEVQTQYYLVNRGKRKKPIGVAIVYFIIDVYSKAIVACGTGLDNNSWCGAEIALLNLVENKKDFCFKFGIKIDENEWPMKEAIPSSILVDNGAEYLSENFFETAREAGFGIDYAPPGTGSLKPNVEKKFDQMDILFHDDLPGEINKEDYGQPYIKKACLDIYQFTRAVILFILAYNKSPMDNYPVCKEMFTEEDMDLSPVNIWNYCYRRNNMLSRVEDIESFKYTLLTRKRAYITRHGIEYKGRTYVCIDMDWLIKEATNAGIEERKPLKIRFDVRWPQVIYFEKDHEREVAFLNCPEVINGVDSDVNIDVEAKTSNSLYAGLMEFEIDNILKIKRQILFKNTQTKLRININTRKKLREIASEALRMHYGTNDIHGIDLNRDEEKLNHHADNHITVDQDEIIKRLQETQNSNNKISDDNTVNADINNMSRIELYRWKQQQKFNNKM